MGNGGLGPGSRLDPPKTPTCCPRLENRRKEMTRAPEDLPTLMIIGAYLMALVAVWWGFSP